MKFKEILVSDLIVNPSNDRHGPTASEETAIAWLFDNKPKEMKRLAERIVVSGRVFDSPLVVPHGSKYLVKDGNRRVTCLKLLLEPSRAPYKFRKFFGDLATEATDRLPNSLSCQVEDDLEVADEIISLRHNGTQEGAGQLMWGPREKANHANRVSGKSDYEWPQLVEEFLASRGHPNAATTIKRSTLDRVLSAEKRRTRLGIGRDESGRLTSLIPGFDILPLLLRFVEDMKEGKLTLKETLVAADVDRYLANLQSDGLLPPESRNRGKKKSGRGTNIRRKPAQKFDRDTLIPRHIRYDFNWTEGQTKIEIAWSQLQRELALSNHKFSIAVVLRTLLEMTAKSFLDKRSQKSKGSLAKDLKAVLDELKEDGAFERKSADDISRILNSSESSVSLENLQRVLHSKSQIPSEDDLVTMWDCLEPLVVGAIRSAQ